MSQTTTTTNASAAGQKAQFTLGQSVKYQYSEKRLRFGRIVEIAPLQQRARVLWEKEEYHCGDARYDGDHKLNVRTWVAFSRLQISG